MKKSRLQRGQFIAAGIVLIVVIALLIATLGYLYVAGERGGALHNQSDSAYFAAKSGLEVATQQLVSGTACAALNNNNVAVGNSTFTTTGTNFIVTAGVTVVGGVTAGATVIPVSSIAALAPHGRVRINNEEINYGGTSNAAAVCGAAPCLVGARRGMGGTTAAAQGGGAVVRQDLCLIQSVGTVGNGVRRLERSLHRPEIMMVYAKATGDANVYYRRWCPDNVPAWCNPAPAATPGWGNEQTASAVGSTITFLVLRFARTRNEAVLATLDTSNQEQMLFQSWNGFSWSATTLMAQIKGNNANGDADFRDLDIAYETGNDRAIIVHDDGASDVPQFRVWDGTTLGAANSTTMTSPLGNAGWDRWSDLAANPTPGSNEIALLVMQTNTGCGTGAGCANRNLRGMIWNGAAWANPAAPSTASWDTPADATIPDNARHATGVSYEQNSGRAVFVWASNFANCAGGGANASRVCYRIWNGAALTAQATAFTPSNGVGQWVRMAPRLGSNELMLGVQTATNGLDTSWWNGAAWAARVNHTATTENTASRNFDLTWEGEVASLGSAQLVWGDSGTRVNRKRWAGGAWGAPTVNTDERTSLVQLYSQFAHDRVLAGIYENNPNAADRDITAWSWRSTTAAWTNNNVAPGSPIWAGATLGDPVDEKVFIQGRKLILLEDQEIFP
jgi:hypothetical protein